MAPRFRHTLLNGVLAAEMLSAAAAADRKQAEIDLALAPTVANQPAPTTKPEGMPDAVEGWRANFERLSDAVAASPLATRQLKRMAAKALARSLATSQRLEARNVAHSALKGRRADKRAAKYANP